MESILVVDDEPRIQLFVRRALEARGFAVDSAPDGAQALRQARATPYRLVILDLLMPGLDGVSVLRELTTANASVRVIVLSAVADARSKVACLELGACDYLPKPFAIAELVARVRVQLRTPGGGAAGTGYLECGPLRLDLERRVVDTGRGSVSLAGREFLLLARLMQAAGSVCTRQELLAAVWGCAQAAGTNVVDLYVARLRAKLGDDAIRTVRNVGYSLAR